MWEGQFQIFCMNEPIGVVDTLLGIKWLVMVFTPTFYVFVEGQRIKTIKDVKVNVVLLN